MMPKLVKPKTIPSYMDRLSYPNEKRISKAAEGPVMLKAPELISPPEGQISAPGQDLTSLTNLIAREGARDLPPGYIEGIIKGNVTQISPVYHGSPYKFDKFKNEAIGTGEGAAAFGYGHYLTESPEAAKYYKEANIFRTDKAQKTATDFTYNGDHYFIDRNNPTLKKYYKKNNEIIDDNIYQKAYEAATKEDSYIYEATLHKGKKPGEYEYLRWDENITPDQALKIKAQAEKEGINLKDLYLRRGYNTEDPQGLAYAMGKGQGAYQTLSARFAIMKEQSMTKDQILRNPGNFGDKEASAFLKRAGIDGIKYPAGSLSGMKSDKFNYVVFDPEDIVIEKLVNK